MSDSLSSRALVRSSTWISRINNNVARDRESAWMAESSTDSSAKYSIKIYFSVIHLLSQKIAKEGFLNNV